MRSQRFGIFLHLQTPLPLHPPNCIRTYIHGHSPMILNLMMNMKVNGNSRLTTLLLSLAVILTVLPEVWATPMGRPFVFWHSQPVKDAETLMLLGANFTPESVIEWYSLPDIAPGNPQPFDLQGESFSWQSLTNIQTTPQLIQAVMPADGAGVFVCRVRNGAMTGAVRRINAPDAWFAFGDQGETASPGGWISVFGTCIAITNTSGIKGVEKHFENPMSARENSVAPVPRIALVCNGKPVVMVAARASDGTRFGQFFDLPANLSPGTYDLYVHNGHGGPRGWATLDDYVNATPVSTITVASRPEWPKTEVNVAQIPGENDDERFASAIARIPQGGIIVVPPGHYSLTKPLILPNKCLLRGVGMEKCCIEWSADPVDAKGKSVPLVRGIESNGGRDLLNRRGSFSLEEITLLASPSFVGTVISREGTKEPAHFHRVAVRATNLNPSDARSGGGMNDHPLAIRLNYTHNLTVADCEIDARNGVNVGNEGRFLRFSGNHFRWRNMNMWFMSNIHNVVVDHNRFSMAGTWAGNGFIKADNQNPGFGFAGYGRLNSRGLYYANNTTDREEKEPLDGSIGITTDKGPSAYFGQLLSVKGTRLCLAGKTSPTNRYGTPPCFPGGQVRVVSGTGAGQSRLLISTNTADVSELEVDHPWDVEPDTNSWISVSYFIGKALFVGNRFSCNPLLQTYYISEDLIYADNIIGVSGMPVKVVLWAEVGLNSWHYQVINNKVTELGAAMKTNIKQMPGYTTGPITSAQIYRNNSASESHSKFTIQIPDNTMGYLIENNQGVTDIVSGKDTNSVGVVRANTDIIGNPVTTTNRISNRN